MKGSLTEIGTSLRAIVLVAVTLCGVYPAAAWLLDRTIFPARSEGSLVRLDDRVVGSRLLSQAFSEPRYFHPRPSAAGAGHDASRSGATNLGPTSKSLLEDVNRRAEDYRSENGLPARAAVPADAVTGSHELVFPGAGMHQEDVCVAVFPEGQCLTGADGDHIDINSSLLLEHRQDDIQQA